MSTSVLCCVYSCNNTCFAHSKVDAEQLEGIKFDGDTIPSRLPFVTSITMLFIKAFTISNSIVPHVVIHLNMSCLTHAQTRR